MDLSTTIIGLVFITIFILPVILISRSGMSGNKKFQKEFFSEVSKNELLISEKAFWNEYAIGMDTSKNKIIYIDWSGHDRTDRIFDLKDVKSFETTPGYGEMTGKKFSYKKAERLGLRFSFKDAAIKDININFYIAGFGQQSDKQVMLFEKWSDIIRKKIESNSKPKRDIKNSA